MIEHDIKFDIVDDPVRTEQIIYEQLKDLDIPYVALPIAYSINKFGVKQTQRIINEIESKYRFKKIYVCQHISVNQLKFYDNLVFTPHTEKSDKYFFIPHFNPVHSKKPQIKKISDRSIKMSFLGDFNTHHTRGLLKKIKSDDVFIQETGDWFFYKSKEEQYELKVKYEKLLSDSKLSLCPRGTGPSTIRLFESLSVGSIPVVFNDIKLPTEIENNIFKIEINDLLSGDFKIPSDDDLQKMSTFLYEYYWDNLSNDNLYKNIIKIL